MLLLHLSGFGRVGGDADPRFWFAQFARYCELSVVLNNGARHSQRVSGAVLNLILGHPGVSGFAPRNVECPVSRREMRNVRFASCYSTTSVCSPCTCPVAKATLTIPDGYYNLAALQLQLAKTRNGGKRLSTLVVRR